MGVEVKDIRSAWEVAVVFVPMTSPGSHLKAVQDTSWHDKTREILGQRYFFFKGHDQKTRFENWLSYLYSFFTSMYGGFIEKGAVYDGTPLFEPCWTDVSATLVGKHPHHPHSWEIYRDNHGQPWATIPSVMGWWEFPLGFLASKSAGFWCLGISMIQGNPLVQIEKKHTNVANAWKTISQEVLVMCWKKTSPIFEPNFSPKSLVPHTAGVKTPAVAGF